MDLQGSQVALFLSGQPVMINSCNIVITPPKIKDIILFNEDDFFWAVNLFGKETTYENLRTGNPQLENYSNFQILMALLKQDEKLRYVTESFFTLIFPQYQVSFRDKDIVFMIDGKRVGMINPFNFQDFSSIINELFLPKSPNKKDYNPANQKALELVEKFKKSQERKNRLAAKSEKSVSIFATYISILSVGMNMDMQIFFNYTPFQIYDIYIRYWKKVSSDFYQRVSTMPMMDTSKMEEPEEWTINLY